MCYMSREADACSIRERASAQALRTVERAHALEGSLQVEAAQCAGHREEERHVKRWHDHELVDRHFSCRQDLRGGRRDVRGAPHSEINAESDEVCVEVCEADSNAAIGHASLSTGLSRLQQ